MQNVSFASSSYIVSHIALTIHAAYLSGYTRQIAQAIACLCNSETNLFLLCIVTFTFN